MTYLRSLIKNLIEKTESSKLSFLEGAVLLYGIFFIRTFLENYANYGNFYHLSGVIDTFFHYPIGFSIILLGSTIIATIITKERITKVAKFIALCSFGLISPPIIDLILNKGGQIPYVFMSGTYPELFKSFLTYFGGGAIGIGIKVEVAFALLGLGIYIFNKTNKWTKALTGMFLLYTVIFCFLSSPTLIFGLQNSTTHQYQSMNSNNVVDFYYQKEPSTSLTSSRTFILENGTFPPPGEGKIMNQYSITLTIIFLIVHAVLFFWCLFLYSPQKFFIIVKNFRYLRILHNFILVFLGIFLSLSVSGKIPIGSLFDLISYMALFLSLFFAWLFAVWENDEADIEIDKVTNQDRPLVKNPLLSMQEWQILKYIFMTYALSFAFLCGLYTFVFMLLFIFVYHIYTLPPTRLKKFPIISSILISVNSLLMVWMGFFLGAGTENLNTFPVKITFGILAIFILVENAKNLKDIEGDKKEGIKTLPVIFGERWGKIITAFFLFLGSLLVPIIFYFNLYTFLASIFFGSILFLLAVRKNYDEKYLFITYFVYVVVFFFLLINS